MTTEFHTISHLRSLMDQWTPEAADAFHGPEDNKAFLEKAKYIWEPANTDRFEGYVFYGPELAAYLNANGEEYILSSYLKQEDLSRDWDMMSQLYEYTLQDPEFNIVQPYGFPSGFGKRNFKTITYNNKNYNYYYLIHPGNDLGAIPLFTLDIEPDDYINLVIEKFNNLSNHLYTLLGDQPFYPKARVMDLVANDQGLYWRFLYRWDSSREEYMAKLTGELQKLMNSETLCQMCSTSHDDVIPSAREIWKNTLNI